MMKVLIPHDLVFLEKFAAIENLFIQELYYNQPRELHPDQAMAIHTAYDSWTEIQQKFPRWLQWYISGSHYEPAQRATEGYELYNSDGKRLTSLYVVELNESELDLLTRCHKLFVQAEGRDPHGPLNEALARLADQKARTAPSAVRSSPVEDFGRALEVLRLQAPPNLLNTLHKAAPTGSVEAVTLTATEEKEYRTFCDQVVWMLSAGDEFIYTTHLAFYA
ncbi:hypothetical protein [Streptomyces sp. NPDC002159]